MRTLFMLLSLFWGFSAYAAVNYADPVVSTLATLQLKTADVKMAAHRAFAKYHWEVEKQTDTSLTGNLNGQGASKIEVSFSGSDSFSVKYLTDHGGDYHHYKRLLAIRKEMLLYLTDCKNLAMKADIVALDSGVLRRRNLVYALSSYQWGVTSISESKVIGSIPGRGRIEADISADGTVLIRHWDDMKDGFTDPTKDDLVRRVQKVFDLQQNFCPDFSIK